MARKSALITGCSPGGVGHALAELLARKGYRVIATMRNPDKGKGLDEVAKANGWDLRVVKLDVRDEASVSAALGESGQIDILVNNAGFEVWGPLEEMTVDDIKDQFETNVYGPFRLILSVVPAMRNRGQGIIVNVSSVAGRVGAPLNGLYSASKYALEALSETLHYELGHFGVRTHIVEPGGIETPFQANRRLVGAAAGHESPYTELVSQWQGVADRLREANSPPAEAAPASPSGAATPEEVASVIVEAIENGDKLRYPVGRDAQMVMTARKAMTDEQFEAAMRAQLGLTW